MAQKSVPAVFSEMLRSFATLARCLNLSQAVDELKLTRQTIRRHINELEARHGKPLFHLKNRQYELTKEGKAALAGAERLLSESETWLNTGGAFPEGMNHVANPIDENRWLYMQQHPINEMWKTAPLLLRSGIIAWTESEAKLRHKKLAHLLPYSMVYRPHNDDWLCVEVGDESSYASWFGKDKAQNSLGRHLSEDRPYNQMYEYLVHAYKVVAQQGGLWYDHVTARLPRKTDEEPEPVHYQRLVTGCTFPDGLPAVLVLVQRTNTFDIPAFPSEKYQPLKPKDLQKLSL